MKVLLVQHQNHARRLFRHLLTSLECTVVECSSVEAITADLKRGPFDLIFIEEPFPEQRPIEPIRRLRAHAASGDAIIVALVERASERDLPSLIAVGADDYMVLPAPLEEVQLRLGVLVGFARRARQAAGIGQAAPDDQDRFFENLPDAAFLLDQAGTIIAVNRHLAELTGYTARQLIGQPGEYIGLPMAEEMPQLLAETASVHDRMEKVTLVRRDMKPAPVVIRYSWLDPEARSIVVGIAREAGGTAPVVEDVEPADASDSEALVFDRRGIIRSISPALARRLETSSDRTIGKSLRDIIHRQDLGRVPRVMASAGSDALQPSTASIRLRSGNGSWLPLEVTGQSSGESNGNGGYALVVKAPASYDQENPPVQSRMGVDSLTGLPDRDAIIGRLAAAIGEHGPGNPVAVLFLNLDRFKTINERHGYAAGDALITDVSRRIEGLLSFADELGRIGGDEFAILAGSVDSHAGAVEFAERIINDFSSRPFEVDGQETVVTLSIGVALADAEATAAPDVLRQADCAAVQAKRAGRGKVRIFESRLENIESNRLHFEQDLSHAVQREELVVHYQPEVDLTTGAIVGVEALVRWNHPSQGMIEPARFIPTAEDAGLIDPIGLWVLEHAARQAGAWKSKFGLSDFGVAVNFSADQFQTEHLVTDLSAALKRAGLPPTSLRVEITESVLIDDSSDVVRRMNQLRKLGVSLAIDDFGTGYSSLSYLRSLPISCIKVDRTFVSGSSAASGELSITRSIASLAHEAGLGVVVEGIESAAQLDRVQQYGCTRGQGFYFSRPVTAETIEFLLMAGPFPFAGMVRPVATTASSQSRAAAS